MPKTKTKQREDVISDNVHRVERVDLRLPNQVREMVTISFAVERLTVYHCGKGDWLKRLLAGEECLTAGHAYRIQPEMMPVKKRGKA